MNYNIYICRSIFKALSYSIDVYYKILSYNIINREITEIKNWLDSNVTAFSVHEESYFI